MAAEKRRLEERVRQFESNIVDASNVVVASVEINEDGGDPSATKKEKLRSRRNLASLLFLLVVGAVIAAVIATSRKGRNSGSSPLRPPTPTTTDVVAISLPPTLQLIKERGYLRCFALKVFDHLVGISVPSYWRRSLDFSYLKFVSNLTSAFSLNHKSATPLPLRSSEILTGA